MNKRLILGYAIGPIGSGIVSFISIPIITWFYSIEDVGRISMLQVFTSLSVLFFGLGLDQVYVREYHETENKPLLLKTLLLPGLLFGIFILLFILIYDASYISILLYEIPSVYLSIITAICFIVGLTSCFLALILRMQERAFAYSMSQLLPKLVFLIFILISVFFGFSRNTNNLITANILSIFFAFLIFSWNTRKEWFIAFTQKIDKQQLKNAFSFGLPLAIGGLASWGLNAMDKLFLRSLSTYSELGVYSVTMSIAGIAIIFAGIFNTIWAPLVYKWVSKNDIDYNKIDEISDYVLAAVYFFIVLSALFSWILPYFLPEEYSNIQYLISACLLGPLFYTLSETTAVGIAISRKTKFSMIASIVAMLVNGLVNYLLIPKYGAFGAAAATGFSYWIFFILRTEFSRLVWRQIPVFKSYIVITILLVFSIINLFFIEIRHILFYIWLIAFFSGFFLFFNAFKNIYYFIRYKLT